MSRLIIKGIPSRYSDKNLRELFSSSGEVTDAKVIKTRDGRSRQFGFIGFRTVQEAKSARNRLNKSYVDTSQVSVDFAHAVGADAIPRPWSKYSKGSSGHERRSNAASEGERKEFLRKEAERIKVMRKSKESQKDDNLDEKDESSLSEFRAITGKRAGNPIWADGGSHGTQKSTFVPSKKTGGEGKFLERKHLTFDEEDSDKEDDELYVELPGSTASIENEASAEGGGPSVGDKVALNDGVSDLDYFKSKIVKSTEDEVDEPVESSNQDSSSESDASDEESKKSPLQTGESAESNVNEENDGMDQGKTAKKDDHFSQYDLQQKQAEKLRRTVDAGETGRLLVRNLAFSITEEELETLFEPYGALSDVHIVKDSQTGKSRGIAFIQYVAHENAPKAIVGLDGTFQSGRIVHILPAKPRPVPLTWKNSDAFASRPGSSAFKAEKEEAQREGARKGLDISAQNAMHLSADAVAGVVADRHAVSKAQLFGTETGESGIAAVRLAMAEANIQGETRRFLLENGINLEVAVRVAAEINANTQAAKRKRKSRTAFLVKNLPARTADSDLESIFTRFGLLSRLIVVPSGLLAVIEYLNASDAKRAYNKLAYTKFRDTPLYFEWLPTEALMTFDKGAEEESGSVQKSQSHFQEAEKGRDAAQKLDETSAKSANVYVKNLNFDTRDDGLKNHFTRVLRKRPDVVRSLRSAKVAMKRGKEGEGQERLSMGFGFLEFSSHSHAVDAVKIAQNSRLDGHVLQLLLSTQSSENDRDNQKKRKNSSKSIGKAGPKLIVRNIAFEATRRDLRQLFSAFGQLKSVRLPQKMDGSHRGFGFIEFISKSEAKAAFDALSAAHLYGRHLVIEYADEASDGFASIGELQEKAAAQVSKKRLRLTDGSRKEVEDIDDEGNDDEAMMRDALYG